MDPPSSEEGQGKDELLQHSGKPENSDTPRPVNNTLSGDNRGNVVGSHIQGNVIINTYGPQPSGEKSKNSSIKSPT